MHAIAKPLLIALCALLLSACDVSRQANAVAGHFWQAMADRDLTQAAQLSTPATRWVIETDIEPMLGQRIEFDPAAAAGRDDLALPSRIVRPHLPETPIRFDTVLIRTNDGFQVDLLATAESFQAGTRAAAAAHYTRAADEVAALLDDTAQRLIEALESLEQRIIEQLDPTEIERRTRALQAQLGNALDGVRAGLTNMFDDVAERLELISRDLREIEPPESGDDAEGPATAAH